MKENKPIIKPKSTNWVATDMEMLKLEATERVKYVTIFGRTHVLVFLGAQDRANSNMDMPSYLGYKGYALSYIE